MKIARVKSWKDFQHYKDRSPPWIKLHRALLDNYEFSCLQIASRALAPCIWLLAAESNDGTVRVDVDWLVFRTRLTEEQVRDGLSGLFEKGFLVTDSETLAACKQSAIPEREGETERETEEEDYESPPSAARVIGVYQPILDAYHEALPKCQKISVLNAKRKRRLTAAVKLAKTVCEQQGWPYEASRFWAAYFAECAQDPWMRGEVSNPKNPAWRQNLDVLLAEDRFASVMDAAIAAMLEAA